MKVNVEFAAGGQWFQVEVDLPLTQVDEARMLKRQLPLELLKLAGRLAKDAERARSRRSDLIGQLITELIPDLK